MRCSYRGLKPVVVKHTLFGIRALRVVAGIVFVVGAGVAEIGFALRSV